MTVRGHSIVTWYVKLKAYWLDCMSAFTALTLLVGHQEEHPACKNWVMRCWHGYLSGVRCKWFAYGPADATVTVISSSLLCVR